jgi:hypothetical protein
MDTIPGIKTETAYLAQDTHVMTCERFIGDEMESILPRGTMVLRFADDRIPVGRRQDRVFFYTETHDGWQLEHACRYTTRFTADR